MALSKKNNSSEKSKSNMRTAKKNPATKVRSRGKTVGPTSDFSKNGISPTYNFKNLFLVSVLALTAGILNYYHVSRMFENERFFSHLSTLERELSFRTEMGLYYSYYKTIAESPSFTEGLHSIMNCNVTEYPLVINTLKRFNLYPEVIIGGLFRMYTTITDYFNIQNKICWTVNRGYGQPPVQSCEGSGDIAYFYAFIPFYLAGFQIFMFFILCFYLSESILGGILGAACIFFNHGEATRVMWTPPLRESFSFPFLITQLFVVAVTLRSSRVTLWHSFWVAVTTVLYMIPWQFAQFSLLTQTCALFAIYILKFITARKLCHILYGLLVGHIVNFIVQFGNSLLLSSFFMSAVISALILANVEKQLSQLPHKLLTLVVQGVLFILGSVTIKTLIAKSLKIKDDAHIIDILRAKFTSFKDFHTLLYVCAPEFNFIDKEHIEKIIKSLLLPCWIVVFTVLMYKLISNEWSFWFSQQETETENDEKSPDEEEDIQDEDKNMKPFAEHLYFLLQSMAYIVMAVLIMRLKLFSTPGMCIIVSLLTSRKLFSFIPEKRYHYALVISVIAAMVVPGSMNLKDQINTKGEFNSPELEELMTWINAKTPSDAVFGGAMPTMAAIKLTTGRPIVNHPHYEDAGLRERTKKIYQIYSRKPVSEVWQTLQSMNVTHVVIDMQWCFSRSSGGCSMGEVWDIEDPQNRGGPTCCSVMKESPKPFILAFENNQYFVYKIHKKRTKKRLEQKQM